MCDLYSATRAPQVIAARVQAAKRASRTALASAPAGHRPHQQAMSDEPHIPAPAQHLAPAAGRASHGLRRLASCAPPGKVAGQRQCVGGVFKAAGVGCSPATAVACLCMTMRLPGARRAALEVTGRPTTLDLLAGRTAACAWAATHHVALGVLGHVVAHGAQADLGRQGARPRGRRVTRPGLPRPRRAPCHSPRRAGGVRGTGHATPARPLPLAARRTHHAVESALEAAHAPGAQHQHVGALAVAVVHDVPGLGRAGRDGEVWHARRCVQCAASLWLMVSRRLGGRQREGRRRGAREGREVPACAWPTAVDSQGSLPAVLAPTTRCTRAASSSGPARSPACAHHVCGAAHARHQGGQPDLRGPSGREGWDVAVQGA